MKNLNTFQLEQMLKKVVASRQELVKSINIISSNIEELTKEKEKDEFHLNRYTTQMKELEHLIESANIDEDLDQNLDKSTYENTSQVTEDDLPF
jgi:hypothetical protein